ncbi:hypothetical protein ACE0DR_25890 [Azotobacter sp. CWF10]
MRWSDASSKNRALPCCVPSQLQQAGETDKALSLLHDVEPKTRQDPELRNAVAIAYDSLGQPAAAERVTGIRPAGCADLGHARFTAGLPGRQGGAVQPLQRTVAAGGRRTLRSACCWARSPNT